jgi:undecaprenyl diphosphate synthase
MTLRLAVDYSARDAIAQAAALTPVGQGSRDEFAKNLAAVTHASPAASPVDLLIRTGGERRLSDFLLWECAYAELVFIDDYWPDFDEAAFAAALREFQGRERRYGSVVPSPPPAPQVVPLVTR